MPPGVGNSPTPYITDTMKRFKLVDMRERYPELIREAEQKQIGYKEFLINLLKAEDEGKSRRKRERLLDHAGFEYIFLNSRRHFPNSR